jgi:hypothetical protein
MISTILFTLSAACFGAMMYSPKKPSRPMVQQGYTYYVCDPQPMPTWKRKRAPMTRATNAVG